MMRSNTRFPLQGSSLFLATLAVVVLGAPVATGDDGATVDSKHFQALEWRSIGPYRGGRVTAVTGVPGDPLRYYMGSAGGGLWTSGDAGTSWSDLGSDTFATSSVGAVAVAPSDPQVIYIGMGEAQIRGVTTSHGDGVYRSTDGGATWSHLGLARTRQISRIRVHPDDPDLVYVAAQGDPWQPSPERGIYRSLDGGRTWLKILEVDDRTGASDLALDPTNPRVLYAGFWQHRRRPWKVESGGPGSGVFKTTDGGDTWQRLEKGLPAPMGKVGVAVSPADPRRVWALVEADGGGLFRSDDGGSSFRRINRDRELRARSWYYTKVFADPRDRDTVYVLNAPMLRSIDGGRSFERVRTPHGDNHDLWIAPENPRRMINGNDGGANVSLNGGATWSTQSNQPTGQFYRVITDRSFPYRVYGGQQDNSTVAIRSRGTGGTIDRDDWYPVGGCESAHVAFDPDDPRLVYAGCYQGLISELDVVTGRRRNIMVEPVLGLGADAADLPYRFNWNAPIVVSPHDPTVLYHAANVVLESRDRGASWTAISPDLTRDEPGKQGAGGGPITNEAAGAETYNTILYLVESPHRPGELWAGSDDGLVHVRRGEGEVWTDVTPPSLGEAMINTIEVSPHDPDRIFLAVTAYKLGDFAPYLYRTDDAGQSWRLLVDGLPEDSFVRVVREDVTVPGLLYAGTETGPRVSFDGGEHWQSLRLALPAVAITDLRVHDADLVASTQGRGFWVLDDLSPLRAQAPATDRGAAVGDAEETAETPPTEPAAGGLELLAPRPAIRLLESDGGRGGPGGKNPPTGAVLDYYLAEELLTGKGEGGSQEEQVEGGTLADDGAEATATDDPSSPEAEASSGPNSLVLEILDGDGEVVRRITSETEEHDLIDPPADPTRLGFSKPTVLPAKAGHNRFVWDLRGEEVSRVEELFVYGGGNRYRVVPGTYTVRLGWGDRAVEQGLEVLPDPRLVETFATGASSAVSTTGVAGGDASGEEGATTALIAAYSEQNLLVRSIWQRVDGIHRTVSRMREVRKQIEATLGRSRAHEGAGAIREAGEALLAKLVAWEGPLVQVKQETFQDVINFPNRLNAQYLFLLDAIDASDPPLTQGARTRHANLEAQWAEHELALGRILALDVAAFNALVAEQQVPAVVVPPVAE